MKKPAVTGSRTQDTSGLSRQCSATEPQQPDNHQPSQSSICTAQVVLNASVAHLAATQYVPSENSLHQERTHAEWFTHWRLKPEVSWVRLPVTAGFFTFLYFRLITSKFIYIHVLTNVRTITVSFTHTMLSDYTR